MKRILALVLCLSCLLGVLSACRDNTEEPVTEETTTTTEAPVEEQPVVKAPLAQYTIVYPKKASKALKETAKRLAASMTAKLEIEGYEIPVVNDDNVSATGYEILIGKTNRPYSQAYYMDALRSEYTVKAVKKSIVLAGFSDAMTDMAVQYFEENYIATATEGKMVGVTEYTCALEKTFELTEANAADVKIVYEKGLEAIATSVVDAVKTATGLTLQKQQATNYKYNAETTEILVGSFGVNEMMDIESSLWIKTYVLANRGNKLIVAATDKTRYEQAVVELQNILAKHRLQDTKGVYLHGDDIRRELSDDVLANVINVSRAPTNVYPAGDGAYVAIYEGVEESTRDGATPDKKFFTEYTQALEAAGYTQYTAVDFDGSGTLKKNKFATYVNDEVTIDIAFHTVGHLGCETLEAIEEGKTAEDYPVWCEPFAGGIMFVTLTPKASGFALPLQEAPAYTPVDAEKYPTIVTQVGFGNFHKGGASNCYIIRLADGTFIIHDSSYGHYDGKTPADEIYNILKKQAPDPNNIVISAWITSHPHEDHMGGLREFAKTYASDPTIIVKQFVHNFADPTIAKDQENSNATTVKLAVKKFKNPEVVKATTGNVLYYANVKFNVLYAHTDHLQLNKGERYDGNSSSLVMQMVMMDGKKKVATVLFGGDHSSGAANYGSGLSRYPFTWNALAEWYGSFIRSDVMTYFHHGLGGGTDWTTNNTIKPKIVLWPQTWSKIEDAYNGGQGTNLMNSDHSRYMTRLKQSDQLNGLRVSFAEGVIHDTPNEKGVYGYFISDDNIQIVHLANISKLGNASFDKNQIVENYPDFDTYFGRTAEPQQ